jgi:hypothetical protein
MKSNKLKIVLLIVVVLLFIFSAIVYNYVYKNHRNIGSEEAVYSIEVNELFQEFLTNQEVSNAKYANKTIEIYGTITTLDLENQIIVLNEQLLLNGEKIEFQTLNVGEKYTFKGRFVGFDDLLEELKMDQCILIKK